MKIEVIDSIEKLLMYKAEWESILNEMNNDNVFLELDWVLAWWKHFSDRHELYVLLVLDDQMVLGFCPLMKTNKRICKEIEFIGSNESGRMDFILKNAYMQKSLECIYNFLLNMKGKNIIKLQGLPGKSLNYIYVKEYLTMNESFYITNCKPFYFLNVNGMDFNTYINSRFGHKTRQKLNRKEKKLESLGNLDYKRITSHELEEVFKIHDKRWQRKIGDSSFSEGETKAFYKELASNNNLKFKTFINAITLNNKILSFKYGIEYNKKYYCIRVAHDDDFYLFSPGELIYKKKIEECFNSQIRVIDFGPGYEPHKAKWTDDYDEVFTIILPSNNFQSKFIYFASYMPIRKLKNTLKKNRQIYNFRKYTLGKIKLAFSSENVLSKIKRIKMSVTKDGALAFLIKCFNDLASKFFSYRQYFIYEANLKHTKTSLNDIQTIEAKIDDLDALSEAMNEPTSKIIKRFMNKHKCYITIYKNKIIHYSWINCSNIEISNRDLKIPFGDHDVYIYDTFIEKKYKNEFNNTYELFNIFQLLYKENYKRCYIAQKKCGESLVSEMSSNIFQPKYKVIETRIFNTIKHNIVESN